MGNRNAIPAAESAVLAERDRRLCLRCTGPGTDRHHRRRRRETSGHYQHCVCNLVTLCRTCHSWAHAHPLEAQEQGFIVPSTTQQPGDIRVKTWFGWVDLGCDGSIEWARTA